jgi:hypothetical protein
MKQKRNDPCPCGSSKKYKKCCAMKEWRTYMEQKETNARPRKIRKVSDEDILESIFAGTQQLASGTAKP